ncbi:MAG TPA: DUF2231 domain-containing protein [Micromonosporaceae bacterium]|nr:DUF2231 domain-containing protein [Micromonosporaceae bacterium]
MTEPRVRVLGHPVHPMLVMLPLGLFVTAVVFDLVDILGGGEVFGEVAYWDIAAGLVGAALAAPFGSLDWLNIPQGTRAKRIGLLHGGANLLVALVFLVVWLVRQAEPAHAAGGGLFVVEILAIGLASVAAWLGGELVDRLGIGVDEEAHPDASSSLRRHRV